MQSFNNKDFSYSKKSKSKDLKQALLYDNMAEMIKKKNRKDIKKKFQKHKQKYIREQKK